MTKRANASAKAALSYFRQPESDELTAKQIRKKERAADAAKMENLRRLRLEKEAADKQAADKKAAEDGQPAAPARRKPARKRIGVRLIY